MIATVVANHLWQSTLFALAACATTLLFRNNSAAARYGLWLAASVKFLIPFSLLVNIGSSMAWPAVPAMTPQLSVAIEGFSRPFGPEAGHVAISNSPSITQPHSSVTPGILVALWLGGCIAVSLGRWFRLRQVRRVIREAVPLSAGREFDVLQRALNARGMRSLPLLSSSTEMEPGVFGIHRPALLLPSDISDRLQDSELDTVISHELSHVRRRDNLTAAVQAIVETIFWFHPMVWWVGGRLIQERERACDQETLASGCEPQVYAQAILRVCEFYITAPRVFVAGVTGSNLKMRIEEIMTYRRTLQLSVGKKLFLFVAGISAIGGPIVVGLVHAPVMQAQSRGAAMLVETAALLASSPITLPIQPIVPVRPTSRPVPQAPTASQTPPSSSPPEWLSEVSNIISDPERVAFKQLNTDMQRQQFIEDFWKLRDRTPDTPENEFRDEYYRRIAYADEHFKGPGGVRGSQMDRGRMYILNGPPDEIMSHPAGGIYYRTETRNAAMERAVMESYESKLEDLRRQFGELLVTLTPENYKVQQVQAQIQQVQAQIDSMAAVKRAEQTYLERGRTATTSFPFETWRYLHIGERGDNLIYEFVDKSGNGSYTLEYDPGAKFIAPEIKP